MISQNIFLYLAIFLCSSGLTSLYIHFATKKNIHDIPNERSLHTVPTPRGGGISIVIVCTIAFAYVFSKTSDMLFLSMLFASLGIGTIGFTDDLKTISSLLRLCVHLFCSGVLIFFLRHHSGGIQLGQVVVPISVFLSALAVLYITWGINFFNFMDGIDEIASLQAIFVSMSTGYFTHVAGLESLSFIYCVIAISSLGFLVFNKSPAKVFMGDAASGFLGFVLAALALISATRGISLFTSMILMNAFIMDSTLTLISRAYQKLPVYSAHRDHIYQHLAVQKKSHSKISLGYLFFNMLVSLPLAYASYSKPEYALALWVISCVPWVFAAVIWKAGIKQKN
jgi:Fuc2NAc and GlcNAc transferase